MSKQIERGGDSEDEKQPDFSAFTRSHADSEKIALAKPLITSDKDNWAKTNIPNGFVMSMIDLVAIWGKIEANPPWHCVFRDTCKEKFSDPEEFLTHEWEEIYRLNMPQEQGRAREEYKQVASAPFSLARFDAQQEEKRLTKEGARH